ncbi:fungal-specific transcription factor domain-containing protein [Dissophora ornata]|nr:hypothetical protein BGZ58_006466 [Dissophora ornata]KAI8600547.1 fungal-specific transcription factor domain-containing protein [Dissophora ornata]
MDNVGQAVRQKRLKAGTACTNCRKKKLRCTGTPNCTRCVTHSLDCVVDKALFPKTNGTHSLYANIAIRASSSSSATAFSDPVSYDNLQHTASHHPYSRHDYGSLSSPSSSCSGDDTTERRHSMDIQSDRRMSGSSAASFSSFSSDPSSPYSHRHNPHASSPSSQHHYRSITLSGPPLSSKSKKQYSGAKGSGLDPLDPAPAPSLTASDNDGAHHNFKTSVFSQSFSCTNAAVNMTSATKKRASKDHGSTNAKQKRKNLATDAMNMAPSSQDSDSNPGSSARAQRDDSKFEKKEGGLKSVVSTMCLDGHGQHFHGSSSGFDICQLSSRFRQGVYPLPMAHLNDSDLWSHSLQITSERELPPTEEMDSLLNLYFQYMYPFSPLFIRKTFMEDYRQSRPDLSQILILNAIFCNACWYSDDVAVKQDSTKYFNRAKIILDETYHVSRISTIQALLLMTHHQYATGNYSGGWLYTGMAIRIALDIGLHRQDAQSDEPEQAEIRKRVWWAVYTADRLGSGVLGRPMSLHDGAFNVEAPSEAWIPEVIGEDVVEYPYEPERIISCRLLWVTKLFMQMGKVLDTMHCIEAEINGTFLADISRTKLPQLHNSLTSWFLSLPSELMYTPYTLSPGTSHPPSPPTALMHMFYYTCLTMLHRPYLRPVNSEAINGDFLISSRNICTAAATNVCHIADSLMLHGQLHDTCYFGMSCLLAAGTVHVHNAITPTSSNRETTRAGLSKTVKAAHELAKTFPVAESLIAIALDVFASQTSSTPSEMKASFIDISSFAAPFAELTHLQSTSISNIYEAARLAKISEDGPGPAPSIQLRHPYGNFSMPLPESSRGQSATKMSAMWQTQIAAAVAMAAIAFGGTDPTLNGGNDQQNQPHFFANPLELPEALRLAPIDAMMFPQIDSLMTSMPTTSSPGLDAFGTDAALGLGHIHSGAGGFSMEQHQHHPSLLQYQGLQQPLQTLQQPIQTSSSMMQNAHLQFNDASCNNGTAFDQYIATQNLMQSQQHGQQRHATMKDDAADPHPPPAISSDDTDIESSSLSDDPESVFPASSMEKVDTLLFDAIVNSV